MEAIVTLLIPVTFFAMLALERLFPARALPKVRFWLLKGFLFFVLTGVINALVPALLVAVVGRHAPQWLARLGTLGGAAIAFIVGDLASYALHRTMHNVHWLWRWTHQMHHSAERMDMAGAVYFHPFDIALQTGTTTLATIALGVTPDAAALAGFVTFFYAMFQHVNVKTPRWFGYFIQRPEAHSIHHARGVHAYNYGNTPLFDVLLGTYRNPETFVDEAGFWDGASSQVGSMLIGKDVGTPRSEEQASTVLPMGV